MGETVSLDAGRIDLYGNLLSKSGRQLWHSPSLISAFAFLALVLSHVLLVLPLTEADFFTATLLVSAPPHELTYRNSGATYAASGTGDDRAMQ